MSDDPAEAEYLSIRELFVAARTRDEFEFACCLLRVRGLEAAGWDPYTETRELIQELLALLSAPLRHKTQIRLALLLYSHLTEADAVYVMLANLLRVEQGHRYVVDPFSNPPNDRNTQRHPPSASAVVGWLCEDLRRGDRRGIADAIESFFDKEIRNAFAHADYVIHEGYFRSPSARFEVDGVITQQLPLDHFTNRLNAAFRVVGAVLDLHAEMRMSYSEPFDTTGRLGGDDEGIAVRLLADAQRGLYGFETATDA